MPPKLHPLDNKKKKNRTQTYSVRQERASLDSLPYSMNRVDDFYERLCLLTNSTVSKKALELFKNKQFRELIDLTVDPKDYKDSPWQHFALDYQIVSFWKKYPDWDIGVDKEQTAFDKWSAGEESNRKINETFRSRWEGSSLFPFHVEEILHLARRKVRDVLGNFDRSEFNKACRFGPGADLGTRGSNTSSYHKHRTSGHSTPAAASVLEEYFNNDVRRCYAHECKLVHSSRLSFVPKNAKTYRAIEVGPRWNVFLQLGLGEMIGQKLRTVGLDIKTQTERNRELVSRAHIDGLATIDLSNASGTLSTNLVIDLLTGLEDDDSEGSFSEWLDLILKLRVTHTEYKGKIHRLEMISGMGNGYTFPLETLIFFVLAWGTCQFLGLKTDKMAVFGDDIIVPNQAASTLIEVLGAVGFTTNVEKTFIEGDFYESCGHDFFQGKNVRPIFVKSKIDSVDKAFVLCNQVVAWGQRLSAFADGCPRSIYFARYKLVNGIPKSHRLFGPAGEFGGVIHSSFDEYLGRRPKGGLEGCAVDGFVAIPKKYPGFSYHAHLYTKLSADVQTRQSFTRRDDVEWRRKEMVLPMRDLVLTDEGPVGP